MIPIDILTWNKPPLLPVFVNSTACLPMVDVFKTNVQEKNQAQKLIALLLSIDPYGKMNFDLEDCDKILRMDSKILSPAKVIQLLNAQGFECVELR